jgi:hypothetical protein
MSAGSENHWWRTTMAKPEKMSPEERAERLKRERDFYELLRRREQRDRELAVERERRERGEA